MHILDQLLQKLENFNNRLSAAQITVDSEDVGFTYTDGPNDDTMRLVLGNSIDVMLCFSTRQYCVTSARGAWRHPIKYAVLRASIWSQRWTQVERISL